mmetsp:Transcript_30152/g.54681  ORF Transcript_30152/g.54681 Transcript_30152/m.54681 type:complete len:237 (+) Transcript_30152:1463-2173(+)
MKSFICDAWKGGFFGGRLLRCGLGWPECGFQVCARLGIKEGLLRWREAKAASIFCILLVHVTGDNNVHWQTLVVLEPCPVILGQHVRNIGIWIALFLILLHMRALCGRFFNPWPVSSAVHSEGSFCEPCPLADLAVGEVRPRRRYREAFNPKASSLCRSSLSFLARLLPASFGKDALALRNGPGHHHLGDKVLIPEESTLEGDVQSLPIGFFGTCTSAAKAAPHQHIPHQFGCFSR